MNTSDLELLSAYLDGQLSPAESARLETRINSDPQLESTLADLRATRTILRQLPQRKAPRNFTLTRKMVGLNPPLPRSYTFFRLATAFASLLLGLTFAANTLAPRLSYIGPINTGWGGGYGGGIGGGPLIQQSAPEAAATEAPLAEESMFAAATEVPVATEAPALSMPALPTATAEIARMQPTAEVPQEKSADATGESATSNLPPEESSAPIPIGWQVTLLIVTLLGAAGMFVLRQVAKNKWR